MIANRKMKLDWKQINTEMDIIFESRPNHSRHPVLTVSKSTDKEDCMTLVDIRCDNKFDDQIDEILFCFFVPPWAPADQKICSKCNGTGEYFCNEITGVRDCMMCDKDMVPVIEEAMTIAEILYLYWASIN